MRAYLDTSVIVPLLLNEALTKRAQTFLLDTGAICLVSDFGAAEFASVVGRLVRIRSLSKAAARPLFARFDAWCLRETARIDLISDDIQSAAKFLRRLDLTLLAPDALHIAICQRIGATLATFDEKMAASARVLGVDVAAA